MSDTWDTIADWYADHVHAGSPMHPFARDVLLDALPADLSGQRVLDLGCGEGLVTRAVAARDAEVVGVDPTCRRHRDVLVGSVTDGRSHVTATVAAVAY